MVRVPLKQGSSYAETDRVASLLEGAGGRAGQGDNPGGQAEGAAAGRRAGDGSGAGTHAGQLPGPCQRNAAAAGQGEPHAVLCSFLRWLPAGPRWQLPGLLEKTEVDEGARASGRGESPAVLLSRGAHARRGMWEHPHGMQQPQGLSASADTSLWLPCQSLLPMEWAPQGRAEGLAAAALTPVGLSLDPHPAGAAGERPRHAAGSPAAGELHPE